MVEGVWCLGGVGKGLAGDQSGCYQFLFGRIDAACAMIDVACDLEGS